VSFQAGATHKQHQLQSFRKQWFQSSHKVSVSRSIVITALQAICFALDLLPEELTLARVILVAPWCVSLVVAPLCMVSLAGV